MGWVFDFSRGNQSTLETAIREYEQENSIKPGARWVRFSHRGNGAAMNVNKEKAANHENHQGQQLGDGEKVADPRSHLYAADVCGCETADQNGQNHETCGWTLGLRPEPCQVINENVGNRGPAAYACQPQKPSRLEAQKTSES